MIYLDNAATSYPKPPEVSRAAGGVIARLGGNPGRGGHAGAVAGGRIMENARSLLCRLLGVNAPERMIFTAGCTDSINLALRGYLHQGDEVLISHAEHNAVMRPLHALEKSGQIRVKVLPPDRDGRIDPGEIDRAVTGRTALCVLCHASNVTGVIQPAREIAERCHVYGFPLLLDAAQTAGKEDLRRIGADMVAMPGHKGLLGPMGVGVLYVGKGVYVRPLRMGGTGSLSESLDQPEMLPDFLESGTPNLPGIAGLCQGLKFVLRHGAAISEYEQHLLGALMEGLGNIPGVTVYGPDLHIGRTAVCAFNIRDLESGQVADLLSKQKIAVRGGLHCAPAIHRHLGTLNQGAVRASPGPFSTLEDMHAFVQAVAQLAKEH